MATTYIPDHFSMVYTLHNVKKTFREYELSKYEKTAFTELIRTEKNNGYNSSKGAENLLKIRNLNNWAKCKITGLRKTKIPNFYYGDLPIINKQTLKEVQSLIVVYIPDDWENIYIRVCPQFYPKFPDHRELIIADMIQASKISLNIS